MISDQEEKMQAQDNLDQSLQYGKLESCRRKFLLGYFNEDYMQENCGNCDRCIEFETLEPATLKTKKSTGTKKTSTSTTRASAPAGDYDTDLFEVLRQLRMRESQRLKVPPYIVFGDKSLRDMCQNKPQTDEAFLKINGVGDKKLKKFGAVFMEAIQEHEG
jgi:ATP-dependent DNA helicase RecQ